jgi:3-dehydroquinate dehydratase-2
VKLLVLHGPSLSALGTREPHLYGTATLRDIDKAIVAHAKARGAKATCVQTNHEGVLIDHVLAPRADGVLLNAGAYAHTSLALADAVRACAVPVVEVHLTNTAAREAVRQQALVGAACVGRIEGFGPSSYLLGVDALLGVLALR